MLQLTPLSIKLVNHGLNSCYRLTVRCLAEANYTKEQFLQQMALLTIWYEEKSYFFGDIISVCYLDSYRGRYCYDIIIRPALYRLNYSLHAKMFTGETLKAVITRIFQTHGINDYELNFEDRPTSFYLASHQSDLDTFMILLARADLFFYLDTTTHQCKLIVTNATELNKVSIVCDGSTDIKHHYFDITQDQYLWQEHLITLETDRCLLQPGMNVFCNDEKGRRIIAGFDVLIVNVCIDECELKQSKKQRSTTAILKKSTHSFRQVTGNHEAIAEKSFFQSSKDLYNLDSSLPSCFKKINIESPEELHLARIAKSHHAIAVNHQGWYRCQSILALEKKSVAMPLLAPLSGSERYHPFGLHFPLEANTLVAMGQMLLERNKPIILGGLSIQREGALVTAGNVCQHIIKTQYGFINLDEKKGENQIEFLQGTMTLSFNGKNPHVYLCNPMGDIYHNARSQLMLTSLKSVSCLTNDVYFKVDNQLKVDTKDILFTAKKSVRLVSDSLFYLKTKMMRFSSPISIISKSMTDILCQDDIKMVTEQLEVTSKWHTQIKAFNSFALKSGLKQISLDGTGSININMDMDCQAKDIYFSELSQIT